MAKVGVQEPLPPNSFPFGKVKYDAPKKRKTPSELRGEQLKRRNLEKPRNEALAPSTNSDKVTGGTASGPKKMESSKTTRYIDTRVDEVFPVRKFSDVFLMVPGKDKKVVAFGPKDFENMQHRVILISNGGVGTCTGSQRSVLPTKDNADKSYQKLEKCSQSTFRSVAEISLGGVMPSGPVGIDMDKALKGLVARDPPVSSVSNIEYSEKVGDLPSISSGKFCSEFHISGNRIPLDLTLKTTMRLVSSSSVKWCHRLSTCGSNNGSGHYASLDCTQSQNVGCSSGIIPTTEALYTNSLCSWKYPNSSLPSYLISAMTKAAGSGEMDFLLGRQRDWEDSFRDIYYMLRKNMCNIFYEKEQAAADDLVELTEIEKWNMGQTRRVNSFSAVDNTSESLLAFMGNENVHSLYDFLLNVRFFLSSLSAVDVPVLCSPVPFQNASLCVPEVVDESLNRSRAGLKLITCIPYLIKISNISQIKVRCKEVKRADLVLPASSESSMDCGEHFPESPVSGICYSIEIKNNIIPPWTISGVCAAMGSKGRTFEANFTADPLSLGLNIALGSANHKSNSPNESTDSSSRDENTFGIPKAVVVPHLRESTLLEDMFMISHNCNHCVLRVCPIVHRKEPNRLSPAPSPP
ncbi:hypothetical protein QJS10_CPB19g01246 [Acorus calamus]|uniref:Uncharacterized protein n=1 Tax=Acorus calamus TaxID=4465 RepID=A0AAV9CGP5_ACOCL|nr:hypothetical protein QJS10_CPB19g01246 [Acorus calamus]